MGCVSGRGLGDWERVGDVQRSCMLPCCRRSRGPFWRRWGCRLPGSEVVVLMLLVVVFSEEECGVAAAGGPRNRIARQRDEMRMPVDVGKINCNVDQRLDSGGGRVACDRVRRECVFAELGWRTSTFGVLFSGRLSREHRSMRAAGRCVFKMAICLCPW